MQNPMTVHEGRPGVFKGSLLEEFLYEQSHRRPHLSLDEVRPTFFRARCTNRDETNFFSSTITCFGNAMSAPSFAKKFSFGSISSPD
jgi:hypothetical protein